MTNKYLDAKCKNIFIHFETSLDQINASYQFVCALTYSNGMTTVHLVILMSFKNIFSYLYNCSCSGCDIARHYCGCHSDGLTETTKVTSLQFENVTGNI